MAWIKSQDTVSYGPTSVEDLRQIKAQQDEAQQDEALQGITEEQWKKQEAEAWAKMSEEEIVRAVTQDEVEQFSERFTFNEGGPPTDDILGRFLIEKLYENESAAGVDPLLKFDIMVKEARKAQKFRDKWDSQGKQLKSGVKESKPDPELVKKIERSLGVMTSDLLKASLEKKGIFPTDQEIFDIPIRGLFKGDIARKVPFEERVKIINRLRIKIDFLRKHYEKENNEK